MIPFTDCVFILGLQFSFDSLRNFVCTTILKKNDHRLMPQHNDGGAMEVLKFKAV